MVKIDSTSELISALRSQLATRSDALRSSSTASAAAGRPETRASVQISIEQLQERIGRELKDLDLKVPANRRRARIIFIESVLTWDFGDDLLNDPQFGFFVRDVEESMSANPDVASSLDLVLSQMHGV